MAAGLMGSSVARTKTRGNKVAAIGVRKAPAPESRPGFIRN